MKGPVSTALLLAAGKGSRFTPQGEAVPKCLIEVGGTSILQRLFDNLRAHGISRLVIVTGFMEERVRRFATAIAGTIELVFVDNADYATTNNIYSLWMARHHIHEPFLLIESDLIFNRSLLTDMLVPDTIAVSQILPWMNGTTVTLEDHNTVESFHLIGQTDQPGSYKTVNIYCLSLSSWDKVVVSLDQYIASGRTDVYYEMVFCELVDSKDLQLTAVTFPHSEWYEIDTVSDQAAANRLLPSWR